MHSVAFAVLMSWSVAVVFAASGLYQLGGSRAVRDAYARWGYAHGFYRVPATILLVTAIFLALPATRVWGAVLASAMVVLALAIRSRHRRFGCIDESGLSSGLIVARLWRWFPEFAQQIVESRRSES